MGGDRFSEVLLPCPSSLALSSSGILSHLQEAVPRAAPLVRLGALGLVPLAFKPPGCVLQAQGCAAWVALVCPVVGAHLELLGVVSKGEETGKDPGIPKENWGFRLELDSAVIRRGESSVSCFSS